MRLPVVRKFDEEAANFWGFFAVLGLGILFYGAVFLNIWDRRIAVETLRTQLNEIQAEHRALEMQVIELNRLNTALLPSTKAGQGLDWETLKYLSFARFNLIAENEGIIHFKD